jgi:hypothetical protein
MHASPVALPPMPRNTRATSNPRASDECARCTCAPASNPSSKIAKFAKLSASGGRVRQCMIGSVRPAAFAASVKRTTNSWSSLWTAHISPVRAISRKASSMVGWSMRGKRTGSYS